MRAWSQHYGHWCRFCHRRFNRRFVLRVFVDVDQEGSRRAPRALTPRLSSGVWGWLSELSECDVERLAVREGAYHYGGTSGYAQLIFKEHADHAKERPMDITVRAQQADKQLLLYTRAIPHAAIDTALAVWGL